MLLKQNNRKAVAVTLLTGLLTLLAGCTDSAAIESLVSPDPKLTESKIERTSSSTQSKQSQDSSTQSDISLSKNPQAEKEVVEGDDILESQDNDVLKSDTESENINLPQNFPKSFPLYPQAQLEEVKSEKNTASGKLTWSSSDNRKVIADYYQAELLANDWKIIKPFVFTSNQKTARAIAIKNESRVDLIVLQSEAENEADVNRTELSVIYQPLEQDIAESSISQAINSADNIKTNQTQSKPKPKRQPSDDNGKQPKETELDSKPKLPNTDEASATISRQDYPNSSDVNFTDLDDVPKQLRQPLEVVAALGVLTPYTGKGNIELSKFAPNEVITRGEYARWLIAANNRYYDDNPGKKIYIATKTNEPAFQDVKGDNPDFGAIQGLAEAGLVPSRLTEDSTNLMFRSDAPLTREDLVTWKVPLDMRRALPKASIQAIEESWGFQDAADIDSIAIRALYADFQNGDRSNVRRIFGYTTLFQPKKPVTRAEAATSIWHFGFQGDGITAGEIWKLEAESNS